MAETIGLHERRLGTRCCGEDVGPRLSQEEAQDLSADLQILAHPIRLQILDMLACYAGQVGVCYLEVALSGKQPSV